MELIARARQLAAIERCIQGAAAGAGGTLALIGPTGAGKTALLAHAAELADEAGVRVVATLASPAGDALFPWLQILHEVGAAPSLLSRLMDEPDALTLDEAAQAIRSAQRVAVLIDDIDRAGAPALQLLAMAAGRAGPSAIIVTAAGSLGLSRELALTALEEDDVARLLPDVSPDLVWALRVASRGLPGPLLALADAVQHLPPDRDPVAHLALTARSPAAFLEVDLASVRLLEAALARPVEQATRARLLARLASELLGDPAAVSRRRELADEALALARRTSEPGVLAAVLDARLQALWDPDGARDRLAAAAEMIELARADGDLARERDALFWRFVALMELARVREAESALAAFEREARLAGDAAALLMATARHAMLAVLRGHYAEAEGLIADVAREGARLQSPDAAALVGTLRGMVLFDRPDPDQLDVGVASLRDAARRLPGHYFEATAAFILNEGGRTGEAHAELQRVLPQVLVGSGPRWVSAVASLASVAAATRDVDAAAALYDALAPYRGQLVVLGGANSVFGPVDHYLAELAVALGRPDAAVIHFEQAIDVEHASGTLPWLARSLAGLADALTQRRADGDAAQAEDAAGRARRLAAQLGMTALTAKLPQPGDVWLLARDGDDWVLQAGPERARLRDSRGLHYLRTLVGNPGQDVRALDLVAGGSGLAVGDVGPQLDDAARAAYRRRLAELDERSAAADRSGNSAAGEAVAAERAALLDELRRSSGLGGRVRQAPPEAERARVNVTRTLRAAIDRLAQEAPRAAAHLNASIRTGLVCRYDPAPGGPARWRT